jgi:hypothetical protein
MPNRKAIEELANRTGAPFTWGSIVDIDGFQGIIVEARGKYVGIILKEDDTEIVKFFHPCDPKIQYYRVIDPGKIREWWVKHPSGSWGDIDNLNIVCASTYMKARYKGWKKFNDAECVTREDLLLIRARRKYSSDDRARWKDVYGEESGEPSSSTLPVSKVRECS